MDWILFIVLLGVVVVVHEFGHFAVAKLSGVRVERFAVGFGPTLLRHKWGETEYAICLLPLGGYVKMTGEEASDESANDPRSFAAKSPLIRMAIAAMGPISNLMLPFFIFTAIFLVGIPTPTTQIGSVLPGSPAERAGLRAGDRITSIEGRSIWRWDELVKALQQREARATRLGIERPDGSVDVSVAPVAGMSMNALGEEVPGIGISKMGYLPAIGVRSPESKAARAGFQTGDIVTHINGQKINHWWELNAEFSKTDTKRTITVKRFDTSKYRCDGEPFADEQAKTVTFPFVGKIDLSAAGLEEGELYIRAVCPGTVAERSGLKPGDLLFSIEGKPLDTWASFQTKVRSNQGESIAIGVIRQGKPVKLAITPTESVDQDQFTREKRKTRKLGVVSVSFPAEPTMAVERYRNPLFAFGRAVAVTTENSILTLRGLAKIFTGQIEVKKAVGGPITIFFIAGSSFKEGRKLGGWLTALISFCQVMAVLSITLGIVNLLPIPVLDGGHILFSAIELIQGKPLSLRVRDVAQQVGLVIIVSLFIFIFYIEVNKYFLDRIKALFN